MMTLDLPQMHSQVVAEFTELSFTRVLQAELKSCKNKPYKLRTLTNSSSKWIQICKSVCLQNLHSQSKDISNKMQPKCHA